MRQKTSEQEQASRSIKVLSQEGKTNDNKAQNRVQNFEEQKKSNNLENSKVHNNDWLQSYTTEQENAIYTQREENWSESKQFTTIVTYKQGTISSNHSQIVKEITSPKYQNLPPQTQSGSKLPKISDVQYKSNLKSWNRSPGREPPNQDMSRQQLQKHRLSEKEDSTITYYQISNPEQMTISKSSYQVHSSNLSQPRDLEKQNLSIHEQRVYSQHNTSKGAQVKQNYTLSNFESDSKSLTKQKSYLSPKQQTMASQTSYQYEKERRLRMGSGNGSSKQKIQNEETSLDTETQYKKKDIKTNEQLHKFSATQKSPRETKKTTYYTYGPGSYEKVTKTYQIEEKKQDIRNNENSGPEYYNISSSLKGHGTQIGSGYNKKQMNTSQTEALISPGPGEYTLQRQQQNKGCSFGKAKRSGEQKQNEQGSDYYRKNRANQTSKDAMNNSKQKNTLFQVQSDSPGPGNYEVTSTLNQKGGPSFGKIRRQKSNTSNPGPGYYDVKDTLNSKSQKTTKIVPGTRDTYLKTDPDVLGPGSYDVKSTFYSKGYSFGRPQSTKNDRLKSPNSETPGPGSYQFYQNESKKAKYNASKFGTSQRQYLQGNSSNNQVGPGDYNYQSTLNKNGCSFGKKYLSKTIESPGPGYYSREDSSQRRVTGHEFGTEKRWQHQQKQEGSHIGPGQYEIDHRYKKHQGYSFGKIHSSRRSDGSPGPGAYNYQDQQQNKQIKAYKFGQSARNMCKTQSVDDIGPGSYNSPTFLNSRGYTMGAKKDFRYESLSPGPGAYSSTDKILSGKLSKSFRFGTEKRIMGEIREEGREIGPGYYNQQSTFLKGGYKFGGKYNQKQSETPGPGAYTLEDSYKLRMANSVLIGTSARNLYTHRSISEEPGPGMYQLKSTIKQSGYSFSKNGQRFANTSKDRSLGPGAYQIQDQQTKKTIQTRTFGTEKRLLSQTQVVSFDIGPGEYSQKSTLGKQGYSFGMKREQKYDNEIPGPGSYSLTDGVTIKGNRSMYIAREQRKFAIDRSQSTDVGPGMYESKSTLNKNGYSFSKTGQRFQQNQKDSSLGPGAYEIKDQLTSKHVKQVGFGTERRDFIKNQTYDNSLGPGYYKQQSTLGKQAYTIGIRRDIDYKTLSPGPGSYNYKDELTRIGSKSAYISKEQRRFAIERSQSCDIGPGMYESKSALNRNGYSFSKNISRFEQNQKVSNLGPGDYKVSDSLTRQQIRQVGFGSGRRELMNQKINTASIGPGYYNQESTLGRQGYSFGLKRDINYATQTPGPGSYNYKDELIRIRQKSAYISKDQRRFAIERSQSCDIGPGMYESRSALNKNGYSFSKNVSRFEQNQKTQNLGPGDYEVSDSLITKQVRQVGFGQSRRELLNQNTKDSSLGPGYYNQESTLRKHCYSFGVKRDIDYRTETPGPGSYNYRDELIRIRQKSAYISKDQRRFAIERSHSCDIGPGMYNSPSTLNKNSYSFSKNTQRFTTAQQDTSLGPGTYNIQDSYTRNQTKQVAFGQEKRDYLKQDNSVGPGQYSPQQIKGNHGYSFGIKREVDYDNKLPGPGYYDLQGQRQLQSNKSIVIGKEARSFELKRSQSCEMGPGSYEVNSTLNKNGYSFSKLKGDRNSQVQDTRLGPGAYDVQDTLTKQSVRQIGFGSSPRDLMRIDSHSNQVGPGQYNTERGLTKQGFTIGVKREIDFDNKIPGPGSYSNIDYVNKDSSKSFLIGKEKRLPESSYQLDQPGPGAYEQKSSLINQGFRFSREDRYKQLQQDNRLGPGCYEIQETLVRDSVRQINFGKERRLPVRSNSSDAIGPGRYSSPSTLNKQGYTIGIKREIDRDNGVPGPGSYDFKDSKKFGETQSFLISKGKRDIQMNRSNSCDKLGPGSYEIQGSIRKQGFTFSNLHDGRHSYLKKQDQDLGPGYYEGEITEFGKKGKSFIIGKGQRGYEMKRSKSSDQIGPGYYNYQQQSSKQGYTFSKLPVGRHSYLQKQDNNLGPGVYDINQNDFGKNSKSFTFRRDWIGYKMNKSNSSDQLGPGHYDHVQFPSKQGFSFSKLEGRHSYHPIKDSQMGPGKYDIENFNFRGQTKSYTIPKEQRGHSQRSNSRENIGPGHYNYSQSPKNQSYTFSKLEGRHSYIKPQDPSMGPGSYTVIDSQTKPQIIQTQISTSIKQIPFKQENSTLGPCCYDLPPFQSSAYTISPKRNFKSFNENPGPGAYDYSYKLVSPNTQSFTILKDESKVYQRSKSQENPGPGYYENKGTLNQHAYTFRKAQKDYDEINNEQKISQIPGPLHYETNDKLVRGSAREVKFAPSARESGGNVKSSMTIWNGRSSEGSDIGPGTYEIVQQEGKAYTFSKDVRMKEKDDMSRDIGPGTYIVEEDLVRPSSKSISFGNSQRQGEMRDTNNVGPGQYNIGSTLTKQTFLINSGRQSPKKQESNQYSTTMKKNYNDARDEKKKAKHTLKLKSQSFQAHEVIQEDEKEYEITSARGQQESTSQLRNPSQPDNTHQEIVSAQQNESKVPTIQQSNSKKEGVLSQTNQELEKSKVVEKKQIIEEKDKPKQVSETVTKLSINDKEGTTNLIHSNVKKTGNLNESKTVTKETIVHGPVINENTTGTKQSQNYIKKHTTITRTITKTVGEVEGKKYIIDPQEQINISEPVIKSYQTSKTYGKKVMSSNQSYESPSQDNVLNSKQAVGIFVDEEKQQSNNQNQQKLLQLKNDHLPPTLSTQKSQLTQQEELITYSSNRVPISQQKVIEKKNVSKNSSNLEIQELVHQEADEQIKQSSSIVGYNNKRPMSNKNQERKDLKQTGKTEKDEQIFEVIFEDEGIQFSNEVPKINQPSSQTYITQTVTKTTKNIIEKNNTENTGYKNVIHEQVVISKPDVKYSHSSLNEEGKPQNQIKHQISSLDQQFTEGDNKPQKEITTNITVQKNNILKEPKISYQTQKIQNNDKLIVVEETTIYQESHQSDMKKTPSNFKAENRSQESNKQSQRHEISTNLMNVENENVKITEKLNELGNNRAITLGSSDKLIKTDAKGDQKVREQYQVEKITDQIKEKINEKIPFKEKDEDQSYRKVDQLELTKGENVSQKQEILSLSELLQKKRQQKKQAQEEKDNQKLNKKVKIVEELKLSPSQPTTLTGKSQTQPLTQSSQEAEITKSSNFEITQVQSKSNLSTVKKVQQDKLELKGKSAQKQRSPLQSSEKYSYSTTKYNVSSNLKSSGLNPEAMNQNELQISQLQDESNIDFEKRKIHSRVNYQSLNQILDGKTSSYKVPSTKLNEGNAKLKNKKSEIYTTSVVQSNRVGRGSPQREITYTTQTKTKNNIKSKQSPTRGTQIVSKSKTEEVQIPLEQKKEQIKEVESQRERLKVSILENKKQGQRDKLNTYYEESIINNKKQSQQIQENSPQQMNSSLNDQEYQMSVLAYQNQKSKTKQIHNSRDEFNILEKQSTNRMTSGQNLNEVQEINQRSEEHNQEIYSQDKEDIHMSVSVYKNQSQRQKQNQKNEENKIANKKLSEEIQDKREYVSIDGSKEDQNINISVMTSKNLRQKTKQGQENENETHILSQIEQQQEVEQQIQEQSDELIERSQQKGQEMQISVTSYRKSQSKQKQNQGNNSSTSQNYLSHNIHTQEETISEVTQQKKPIDFDIKVTAYRGKKQSPSRLQTKTIETQQQEQTEVYLCEDCSSEFKEPVQNIVNSENQGKKSNSQQISMNVIVVSARGKGVKNKKSDSSIGQTFALESNKVNSQIDEQDPENDQPIGKRIIVSNKDHIIEQTLENVSRKNSSKKVYANQKTIFHKKQKSIGSNTSSGYNRKSYTTTQGPETQTRYETQVTIEQISSPRDKKFYVSPYAYRKYARSPKPQTQGRINYSTSYQTTHPDEKTQSKEKKIENTIVKQGLKTEESQKYIETRTKIIKKDNEYLQNKSKMNQEHKAYLPNNMVRQQQYSTLQTDHDSGTEDLQMMKVAKISSSISGKMQTQEERVQINEEVKDNKSFRYKAGNLRKFETDIELKGLNSPSTTQRESQQSTEQERLEGQEFEFSDYYVKRKAGDSNNKKHTFKYTTPTKMVTTKDQRSIFVVSPRKEIMTVVSQNSKTEQDNDLLSKSVSEFTLRSNSSNFQVQNYQQPENYKKSKFTKKNSGNNQVKNTIPKGNLSQSKKQLVSYEIEPQIVKEGTNQTVIRKQVSPKSFTQSYSRVFQSKSPTPHRERKIVESSTTFEEGTGSQKRIVTRVVTTTHYKQQL